ncbi:pseudouridine synthase [Candidatus Mycoplasma mahonii]|uniref:pseudouridine synthase n=1 Tax=Candidatus Mycoplasma mahonii TaxID=3004105 RepID=UPI0026F27C56|nr:pseudouridine synthase [Candidatus Mycoplasma mahonii]WKX02223.1 pseudouridine synthase [Candidatus Mycoplasma mahonii]
MNRIQKLMSQAGIASRRKSEEIISEGRVIINGKVATLGDKATFADEIIVDGKPLFKEEDVYYMINKPERIICSLSDPQNRTIITDLIDDDRHIFPIGRLDYNTTGTLLLTNDGELSNKLTHPSFGVVKVYRARLLRSMTLEELKYLNSDQIIIDDKESKQKVTKVENKTYVIALTTGTYHHVKRLFEIVNNEVLSLTRIEFAGLSHAGNLSKGKYRKLTSEEVTTLKELQSKNNV